MALICTSALRAYKCLVDFSAQRSCQIQQLAPRLTPALATSPINTSAGAPVLDCASSSSAPVAIGGGWSLFSVRHKVRNKFPKPRDFKRLLYTWEKRMETSGGRSILMRRILKGRHSIAHPPCMQPHWPHRAF